MRMSSLAPLLALLTACPATAQVTASAFADTELVAVANGVRTTLPRGTRLLDGMGVSADDPNFSCPANSAASIRILPQGSDLTFRFANGATASGNVFACLGRASAGSHAVLVTLAASQPTRGRIRITTTVPRALEAMFSVDVGNDGVIEMASDLFAAGQVAGLLEMPVTLDTAGLPIRIVANAVAVASPVFPFATAQMDVEVKFLAGDGRLVPIGQPCGPALGGFLVDHPVDRHALVLGVTGSPVTPHAFFGLGITQINLPIPPLGCVLRTDILIPVLTPVSSSGTAALRIPLGASLPRGDVIVQYLAATVGTGGTVWRTSDALLVHLP
ncbi:MAG: hypothetical protein IPM29_32205 [Planctomycetes bacterium]|nr:hypothetical protein [Planctomycetota bacterium]